jgi:hypothetical protein
MRASNVGERKLTELDFARLKKFTEAGAFAQLDPRGLSIWSRI